MQFTLIEPHTIHLVARGIPTPKGSSRAMMNKHTKRAILVPSGSDTNKANLREWKAAVIDACMNVRLDGATVPAFPDKDVPLCISIVFRIKMPGKFIGKYGPLPKAPLLAPSGYDSDKLERSTYDAITQSQRIWTDDARVAGPMAWRRHVWAGQWLGAVIRVSSEPLALVKWHYDQFKAGEAELQRAKDAAEQAKLQARARKAPESQGALL